MIGNKNDELSAEIIPYFYAKEFSDKEIVILGVTNLEKLYNQIINEKPFIIIVKDMATVVLSKNLASNVLNGEIKLKSIKDIGAIKND